MKLTEELQEVQNIFSVELTPTVLSEYKSNICRIAQGTYMHKSITKIYHVNKYTYILCVYIPSSLKVSWHQISMKFVAQIFM